MPLRRRACLVVLTAMCASHAVAGSIAVTNLRDGETLRYSAPLLVGTTDDAAASEVTVTNLSSNRPGSRVMNGQALNGRFKAMTELVPGENHLQIACGKTVAQITLNFKPQTNAHFIRAVFFVDNTGSTKYDTPIATDPQNYADKFDATMKLMQTFTAEWMNFWGYGRRTFNLELDSGGKVVVHVVKGKHPAHYYEYELQGRGNLYDTVADEAQGALPKAESVDCTLIGFSKLDEKTGKSVAYTALGGGKVALFGGACMYSFPNSVADIQRAFMDPVYIDGKHYVSDSVDRFTMWSTASTSIGAMMHETGHSMGLPHSQDRRDMMTRGMDYISRNFTLVEPPSKRNKDSVVFKDTDIGYWSPESAAALAPTVWLDMDAAIKPAPANTAVDLSPDGSDIIVKSPSGIGFVGYEIPGVAKDFVHIDQDHLPNEVRLPLKTALAAVSRERGQLRIIDGAGNMTQANLNEFGAGFIRAWQFAATALPWPGGRDAPVLDTAAIARMSAAIAAQPLSNTHRARVDFEARYPAAVAPRVGYVLRTIKAEAATPINLLTGSDDGLRVWHDGKLVTTALKPRAAKPDSETTALTLHAGDNRLLFEVTDTGGAWALFARLTTADGKPLQLNDDGSITPIEAPSELMK